MANNNIDTNKHFTSLFTANGNKLQSLSDLFYEGFYLLILIKNGSPPENAVNFRDKLYNMLNEIEINAKKMNISSEDIYVAKYAFCASIDEAILANAPNISYEWQRKPLQLIFFGDHLAGEKFFIFLEEARRIGAARIQSLEIFYMCLLLGFKGKYFIDVNNEVNHLINRIGEEIKYHKGKKTYALSPHAFSIENVSHTVSRNFSLLTIIFTFFILALMTFLGLKWQLNTEMKSQLKSFQNLIHTPQKTAEIVITLP